MIIEQALGGPETVQARCLDCVGHDVVLGARVRRWVGFRQRGWVPPIHVKRIGSSRIY